MLDDDDTSQDDLRGGTPPWGRLWGEEAPSPARQADPRANSRDRRCDVLIVGAGITGSMMAEHLVARGLDVVVVDREKPGFGSTTASTAMLQWEIDAPLRELTGYYGFDKAAKTYLRSLEAVQGMAALVRKLGIDCGLRDRHTLYIAAGETGPRELLAEHEARKKAGLPGEYLDHPRLLSAFGIDRGAAIVSPGSADADPVRLAHGLLTWAVRGGATLIAGDAEHYDAAGKSVGVTLADGSLIEARNVVLATGYVMPDFIETELHSTASSWAIATSPQKPENLWRDGALIWEASETYCYARTTTDNRIIIGGEDDDTIIEPEERDALIGAKAATLSDMLARLWPKADPRAQFMWAGAFGETTDGLPLIGPVEGHKGIHAAYGYGGNGITFSFMASRMIGTMVTGGFEPWFDDFAIARPDPT
jgi:glycine/D-amino acid oxidase-like deaminating enzyme